MILKEIVDFNSSEFQQGMEIYKSSFPPNETRPYEKIIEMLKNDKDYHLLVAVNNSLVIGISLMYIFRSLGFGLLDYLAIIPSFRRQGVGKRLFNYTFEKFCINAPNGMGLLLEIQKEDGANLKEITERKNRLRFYSELGVELLYKVNYMLPQIHPGMDVEEMYLMIKPIRKISYLPKETVIEIISNIYSIIYQQYPNDYLNDLSKDTPEKIILIENFSNGF